MNKFLYPFTSKDILELLAFVVVLTSWIGLLYLIGGLA
jgi:hypothetical protein